MPDEEGTTLENGSGSRQYNNSNAPSNRVSHTKWIIRESKVKRSRVQN